MSSVANQAKVLAEQIKNFFIVTDENGNFEKWTNNAKALAVAFIALSAIPLFNTAKNASFLAFASKETGDSIAKIATSIGGLTKGTQLFAGVLKTLTGPVGIILAVVGVLYATNEEFRESINGLIASLAPLLSLAVDLIGQVVKPIIPLLSGLANILGVVLSFVVKVATGIIYVAEVIVGVLLSPIELVIKGISTILVLLETLFNWNWSALGEKLSKIWSNWAIGDIIVGGSQGLGTTVRGYADGGYTNANLIMTHENGKREWVGKAAGSSAIVNDTQMSDIMEVAVAKGVVLGNRALANQGSDEGGVIHNHIYLDGKQIYEGVTDTAKKYGKKWATV
jgi:phage-related protein